MIVRTDIPALAGRRFGTWAISQEIANIVNATSAQTGQRAVIGPNGLSVTTAPVGTTAALVPQTNYRPQASSSSSHLLLIGVGAVAVLGGAIYLHKRGKKGAAPSVAGFADFMSFGSRHRRHRRARRAHR